jgi:hypothetical protein
MSKQDVKDSAAGSGNSHSTRPDFAFLFADRKSFDDYFHKRQAPELTIDALQWGGQLPDLIIEGP